jgi:hypothetical protein
MIPHINRIGADTCAYEEEVEGVVTRSCSGRLDRGFLNQIYLEERLGDSGDLTHEVRSAITPQETHFFKLAIVG